jgi:CBS domain-containing protein
MAVPGAVVQAWTAQGRPGMVARDVMRPKPRHVGPDESLAKARELMTSLRTRELPVLDGVRLVGIVTRSDMEPYHGHYEWTPVRTAMTTSPVSVTPDTPLEVVATILLDGGFNSVPVSTDGELVGMIARRDVLGAFAPSRKR